MRTQTLQRHGEYQVTLLAIAGIYLSGRASTPAPVAQTNRAPQL